MVYSGPGYVRIHDGRDGAPLRTIQGDASLDHFGASLGGCGDVNGDGGADFIIGAYQLDPPYIYGNGYARVFLSKPFLRRR